MQVLLVALLLAGLSLWSAQDAWGVTVQKVDEDPQGSPYVAGELLVVYEPNTRSLTTQSLPEEVQGRAQEEIP